MKNGDTLFYLYHMLPADQFLIMVMAYAVAAMVIAKCIYDVAVWLCLDLVKGWREKFARKEENQ